MQKRKKIFSKIYDEYIERVYRFIFLKVNSREVAQDLASETFLRFWESLNSPTEIKNAKAFVYQIARNLVIDYYRQRPKPLISLEEIQIKDPNNNPEREALLDSDLHELNLALAKMPGDYQDVIIWYYLDELSVREISKILDKSENAARIIIHRALESLRKNLSE